MAEEQVAGGLGGPGSGRVNPRLAWGRRTDDRPWADRGRDVILSGCGRDWRTMIRPGVLRCLVAAVLFGASAPAASKLAGEMPVLVLAGLLYLGVAMAVAPATARRRPTAAALVSEWRPAGVAVLVGGAVGPALFVAG